MPVKETKAAAGSPQEPAPAPVIDQLLGAVESAAMRPTMPSLPAPPSIETEMPLTAAAATSNRSPPPPARIARLDSPAVPSGASPRISMTVPRIPATSLVVVSMITREKFVNVSVNSAADAPPERLAVIRPTVESQGAAWITTRLTPSGAKNV